jgi:hypothetical protein
MTRDRELGDEPAPAWRDAGPDVLSPIDEAAPVSGHRPAPEAGGSPTEAPEHDWSAASPTIFPALRPPGAHGTSMAEHDASELAREGLKTHATPLVDSGPVDLVVAYVMRTPAFDVLVNADHLLSWGVEPDRLRATAMGNLAAWSASAPWTDELSGHRRVLSSDTGQGADAARILLPEVRQHLATELGTDARVLVAIPDQDLLVAGSVHREDPEFASLFCGFCAELSAESDDPVDQRVFELVDGELVPYAG